MVTRRHGELFHAIANKCNDVAKKLYVSNCVTNCAGLSPLSFALMHGNSAMVEHILDNTYIGTEDRRKAIQQHLPAAIVGSISGDGDGLLDTYCHWTPQWEGSLRVSGSVKQLRWQMANVAVNKTELFMRDRWEETFQPWRVLLHGTALTGDDVVKVCRLFPTAPTWHMVMLLARYSDDLEVMRAVRTDTAFYVASQRVKEDVVVVANFLGHTEYRDRLFYLASTGHWLARAITCYATQADQKRLVELSVQGKCLLGVPIHTLLIKEMDMVVKQLPPAVRVALADEVCKLPTCREHALYSGEWLYDVFTSRDHVPCRCTVECPFVRVVLEKPPNLRRSLVLQHVRSVKVLNQVVDALNMAEEEAEAYVQALVLSYDRGGDDSKDVDPMTWTSSVQGADVPFWRFAIDRHSGLFHNIPDTVRTPEMEGAWRGHKHPRAFDKEEYMELAHMCDTKQFDQAQKLIEKMQQLQSGTVSKCLMYDCPTPLLKAVLSKVPRAIFQSVSIPSYARLDDAFILDCMERAVKADKDGIDHAKIIASDFWYAYGNDSPTLRVAFHCGPHDLTAVIEQIRSILGDDPPADDILLMGRALDLAILRLKIMAQKLPFDQDKSASAARKATEVTMHLYNPYTTYGKILVAKWGNEL